MAQPGSGPVYLTVEEFETYDLPEDMRAELVRGELLLIPPPGAEHGVVGARLIMRLAAFVEAQRLGVVTMSSGYVLVGLPRTVRAPDIAFVLASRLSPDMVPASIPRMRPDLAIEIRSPSERRSRLKEKLEDYRAVGVPVVWVVDPRRQTVSVIVHGHEDRILRGDDVLEGGSLLPGFSLRLSELF